MNKLIFLLFILSVSFVYAEDHILEIDNNTNQYDNTTKQYIDAENYYINTYLGSKYDIYAVEHKDGSYNIITDPHINDNLYKGDEDNIFAKYVREDSNESNTILVIEEALRDIKLRLSSNNKLDITDFGYSFNASSDPQISCSNEVFSGRDTGLYESLKYRDLISHGYDGIKNRALLKAIDYLKSFIDKGEYGVYNHYLLYTALAYYAQDGLYNIDEIIEYARLFKKNYKEIEYNEKLAADFEPFILKLAESTSQEPAEFYKWAESENILHYVLFKSGYFDIYNDGVYQKVYISKVNEQSIIFILDELLAYNNKDLYARYYYKVTGKGNKGNPFEYTGRNCINNLYAGNLYIMPFNKAAYIINTTEVENKLTTIEIRNPAYFNTEYGSNYFGSEIFKNYPQEAEQHEVSQMETFGINGSVIYEKIYERDIMSAAGDVDTLKNSLDPDKILSFKNISKTGKVENLISYLQEYTDINISLSGSNILFYNISTGKTPVYLAFLGYYTDISNKQTNNAGDELKIYYFLLDKNLKILNKDVAKEINAFVYNTPYYKTVLTYINNNPHIVLVKRSGEVLIINIEGEKTGYAKFPSYYYTNEKEKTNPLKDKTTLLGMAELDCSNAVEDKFKMICSNRQLLTYRAYIDILYNRKMKKAEVNHYPANVVDYYNQMYSKIMQDYGDCGNSIDCYIQVFRKYEALFLN